MERGVDENFSSKGRSSVYKGMYVFGFEVKRVILRNGPPFRGIILTIVLETFTQNDGLIGAKRIKLELCSFMKTASLCESNWHDRYIGSFSFLRELKREKRRKRKPVGLN